MTSAPNAAHLERHRNKVLAKTFYRHLRSEGLTHEQIIELSTELLDMVTNEMRETPTPAVRRAS